MIMFARRPVCPPDIQAGLIRPKPLTTFLLAIWYGVTGVGYFIAVGHALYIYFQRFHDHYVRVVLGAVVGVLVGTSFLIGAVLLFRRRKLGLAFIAVPILLIAAQWFGPVTPSWGQFFTFCVSLVGVVVSWFELRQPNEAQPPNTTSDLSAGNIS
jgi:hypothetical protein